MILIIVRLIYLISICSCFCCYAQNDIPWTKLELTANLPAPYGETSVIFSTSEKDGKQVVNSVEMINQAGNWIFSHPKLHQLSIASLNISNAIMIEKNCSEFQQDCISFSWRVGEPRYITFVDGITDEFYLIINLKISEQGRFDFSVEDTYQEGLKLEQQYREFMLERKESSSVTQAPTEQKSIAFDFLPAISIRTVYYGRKIFYYESSKLLGNLSIENTFVEGLPANYQLLLPSGNLVAFNKAVKESKLRFSGLSYPLVSIDDVKDELQIVFPCLIGQEQTSTLSYLTVKIDLLKNKVVNFYMVKHITDDSVCDLK